jgi:hypothetical protein
MAFSLAAPLVAAQAALLAVGPLSRALPATLALWALLLGALAWAVRRANRGPTPTPGGILAVAFALRVLALPLEPTLSDDVKRYVWDGRVALAGANPYRHAPEAEELAGLRDELWQSLPHASVPTVYPPLALAGFSIAALAPAPIPAWKGLVATADLAGVWFLLRIARRRGIAPARCLWYAWHPLAVWEGAGMGHVDALGVAACLAALWLLLVGRERAAGAAAAAGVLLKLVPLVALPLWARTARAGGRRFLTVAALVGLAFTAPVLLALGGVPPGLLVYGKSWEFNGPLYEPLWRVLDGFGVDGLVKSGIETLKVWTGADETLNRFFPYIYPQLLAKLSLLGVVALALWRSVRSPGDDPPAETGRLFAGVLVASATFYPWYALWILPWAALCRQPAWLLAAALLPLSYLPQFAGVEYFPWIWLAIWGPPAALALSHSRFRRWSSV